MNANVMEKEKGFPHAVLDLEAAQALQARRWQEAAEAREKKLLAELEARYDAFHRQLEESFAEREKKLFDDLQARHAAECRRIGEAAQEREASLLTQLGTARRQLLVVVVAAILGLAVVLNLKAKTGEIAQPALPSSDIGPEAISLSVPAAPAADMAEPAADIKAESLAVPSPVKTGNGGNFSGGRSSAK